MNVSIEAKSMQRNGSSMECATKTRTYTHRKGYVYNNTPHGVAFVDLQWQTHKTATKISNHNLSVTETFFERWNERTSVLKICRKRE